MIFSFICLFLFIFFIGIIIELIKLIANKSKNKEKIEQRKKHLMISSLCSILIFLVSFLIPPSRDYGIGFYIWVSAMCFSLYCTYSVIKGINKYEKTTFDFGKYAIGLVISSIVGAIIGSA